VLGAQSLDPGNGSSHSEELMLTLPKGLLEHCESMICSSQRMHCVYKGENTNSGYVVHQSECSLTTLSCIDCKSMPQVPGFNKRTIKSQNGLTTLKPLVIMNHSIET
jgi:hypothetical protein